MTTLNIFLIIENCWIDKKVTSFTLQIDLNIFHVNAMCFISIDKKNYFYEGRCHPSYLNVVNIISSHVFGSFQNVYKQDCSNYVTAFLLVNSTHSDGNRGMGNKIKLVDFVSKEIAMQFIHNFYFRKKLQDIWSVGGIIRKRWDNRCISNIVSVVACIVVPCNILRTSSIWMNVWRNDFSVIDGQWFGGNHSNHGKQNNCNLH